MRFDVVTLFPGFFESTLRYGILERALRSSLAAIHLHDLRDFTHDRHRTVDDRPFGGGEGMVLKPQPIFECVESLGLAPKSQRASQPSTARESVILLSAGGRRFTQSHARHLATLSRVVLICGRYEGVDERVSELLCDDELSIGDFVLSGGELAAAIIIDAAVRLIPGVLGHEDSSLYESFGLTDPDLSSLEEHPRGGKNLSRHPERSAKRGGKNSSRHPERSAEREVEGPRGSSTDQDPQTLSHQDASQPSVPRSTHGSGGLLDYPHYTRPADFRGVAIPDVLSSGDHSAIRRWRRRAALARTLANRPDLLAAADLTDDDREFLANHRAPDTSE